MVKKYENDIKHKDEALERMERELKEKEKELQMERERIKMMGRKSACCDIF